MDILSGITTGENTFFTLRGNAPCYIGQLNYWTSEEKNTLLHGTIYVGPNVVGAAPGLAGDFDTTIEMHILHNFGKRLVMTSKPKTAGTENASGHGAVVWSCTVFALIT